ncbi:MAG: OsmC family protein [Flavobacteriales bacterium]|nr:OsmC family protein [Flavobacteriales bacterium]
MDTAHINHLGELRTEVIHVRSQQRFLTDAPVDNQGRGEAISPTDMLAASLAACMLTTMDIKARAKGIALRNMRASVVKHMAADPRRVSRVEITIELDGEGLSSDDRSLMEHTAHNCPVALSLHPGLLQDLRFSYR